MLKRRNTFLAIFLVFTVLTVVAHRLGGFTTKLDLLDSQNHTAIYGVASGNVTFIRHEPTTPPSVTCSVDKLNGLNFCSISILLSHTGNFEDLKYGRDLSSFKHLSINIDYSTPNGEEALRLSFRHYDEGYIKEGDFSSLKYNSFITAPTYQSLHTQMSLASFGVEKWWIDEKQVAPEDTGLDFTNVPLLEISPHQLDWEGDYHLKINTFTLYGEYISEASLLLGLLAIWAVITLTLIFQRHQHFKGGYDRPHHRHLKSQRTK